MGKIINNGAGTSLDGWIVQNTSIVNDCFNIQNGYIKQVIGIDGDKRYRQYKLSYNCVELRDRHSYFLLTTTKPPLKKDAYFVPILFDGEQVLIFDVDESITDLTFEVVGDLKIKDIDLRTNEGISENTKQEIGMWQEVTDGLGNILASKLVGALDSSVANIINANNTMIIEDGLFIRNASTDEASTWAMQITSAGWMIADGKNPDGTWNWRTAATGKGLVADAITTGKLSAIDLESVNILASTILGALIQGGRIEIGDNASKTFIVIDGNEKSFGIKMKNTNNELKSIIDLWGDTGDGGNLVIYSNSENADGSFKKAFHVSAYTETNDDGCVIHTYGDVEWYANLKRILFNSVDKFEFFGPTHIDTGGDISGNNIYASGDLGCGGTKTAIVQTKHYGKRKLYCEEADKLYFSTKGIAETAIEGNECKYILRLDDIFFETIEPNSVYPYIINATPYADARVWVSSVYDKYIIFKSDKPTRFAYSLQAIRKGYANTYLEEVE